MCAPSVNGWVHQQIFCRTRKGAKFSVKRHRSCHFRSQTTAGHQKAAVGATQLSCEQHHVNTFQHMLHMSTCTCVCIGFSLSAGSVRRRRTPDQKCARQIFNKWHLILFIKKSIKKPYSLPVCKRCAFQGRARANPLHQLMMALITARSRLMKARWPADPLAQHKAPYEMLIPHF